MPYYAVRNGRLPGIYRSWYFSDNHICNKFISAINLVLFNLFAKFLYCLGANANYKLKDFQGPFSKSFPHELKLKSSFKATVIRPLSYVVQTLLEYTKLLMHQILGLCPEHPQTQANMSVFSPPLPSIIHCLRLMVLLVAAALPAVHTARVPENGARVETALRAAPLPNRPVRQWLAMRRR